MLIPHKGHTDTIQVYSVTVMTHVKALQAGHSSQGTSEPITPAHFQQTQFEHIINIWACSIMVCNPIEPWFLSIYVNICIYPIINNYHIISFGYLLLYMLDYNYVPLSCKIKWIWLLVFNSLDYYYIN